MQICLEMQINGRARRSAETVTNSASWQLYKVVSSARFTARGEGGLRLERGVQCSDKEVGTKRSEILMKM